MDINERLQQEQLCGLPKINPDEQRRYLGTVRERVIAAIKVSQLTDKTIQSQFEKILTKHSTGKVLIDQTLTTDNFPTFVSLATKTHHPFTVLSDVTVKNQVTDPIAVLLAADTAVNVNTIYLD